MPSKKISAAAHARNYGASELALATMTGHYPPPHNEMDERWAILEDQQFRADLDRELREEQEWFDKVFARAFPDG